MSKRLIGIALAALVALAMGGCAADSGPASGAGSQEQGSSPSATGSAGAPSQAASSGSGAAVEGWSDVSDIADKREPSQAAPDDVQGKDLAKAILKGAGVKTDFRDSFVHGDKGARYQKYIVLHDTEGGGDPEGVVGYWDGNGRGVAAHFVVARDGSAVQCVKLDKIAHHAGYGDTGHNELYGVEGESRDDKVGSEPIGDWASDYGMNSYSIGIEMIHVGGQDEYTEAQLETVDAIVAAIDAYYGEKSEIIDHKAWRTGNSDTSEEFSRYLKKYQGKHRTHDGKPFEFALGD